MSLKPNSQNARILRVLSDGKWHSAASIHRKAGQSIRLSSRISQLRHEHGYEIEREAVPGKKGALGHRYRLTNPPAADELAAIIDPILTEEDLEVRGEIPRDMTHRYRVYRMVYEELELVATASEPSDVGEAIVALGREGIFAQSCVGVLDTHGTDKTKGEWVVNPFDSAPL